MSEENFLLQRFEADRARLRGVAYRMLGSLNEAEDAVQEAWIRLARADAEAVENLSGWLTTVVARICLDMLRARKTRREEPLQAEADAPQNQPHHESDPEEEAMLADSVGLALMIVLERLTPAERVAFVLHDMFSCPFDDIARIVGRSADAARQLASRARRRVRGEPEAALTPDRERKQQVLAAFLTAARGGDMKGLIALLDPEVALNADATAAALGGPAEQRGAEAVARFFSGRAQAARTALIDGTLGLVVAPAGRLMLVLDVTVENGRIAGIRATADPDRLARLDIAVVDG
ncbi:sigma-70 family RNA polymerase sigma factor [Mesorhizobium xinjiangense]|uniref:sigma-70 family RNA polymerase sigma factor n=1 Tax=Mesorhizobium xinjiangense TaxID=2678685 RepID=UPI0012ED6026|nr:sigma-70 family RNA polymerase sigma factor [Mesorhizobium xinjiangense]